MADNRIRIAVVFGGRNGEHDVSCESAASILTYLDRSRYHVIPVKIETDGSWIVGADDPEVFSAGVQAAHQFVAEDFTRTHGDGSTGRVSIPKALDQLRDVDVVFPALHGPYGEDGKLQAMLKMLDIPFVGNGVLAGAVGMDKEYTKKLLAAAGLPVADGAVLRTVHDDLSVSYRDRLGLPVFVKPARAGSSLGVSRVDSWDELPDALAIARKSDPKVLVEETLTGREIDLGVLEFPDGSIEVSPPLEIKLATHQKLFDYEAKYSDSGVVFDVPAKLDPETLDNLRALAKRAFEALECTGLLRVDCFVTEGGAVINEVNTFPGFTSHSQFPQMWQAVGLGYAKLLDVLIETALNRVNSERTSPVE